MRVIFEGIDTDGSGTIGAEELMVALQRMGKVSTQPGPVAGQQQRGGASGAHSRGWRTQAVTGAEVRALMSSVDPDGNGELDFEEFVLAAESFSSRENARTIRVDHGYSLSLPEGERAPEFVPLRPAQRQALVDREWERLRREREELGTYRGE